MVNNKTETWENDFTFTGTGNLLFGTGQTTLGGPGSTRVVTVNASTLSVGSVNGTVGLGYGLTKQGAGILAFGPGAASTISGVLNVIGGRFQIGINDFTCGGFTGNAILENASGTTRWLFVNVPTNTVNTFTGIIRDGGGAGRQGLNKLGLGTLVLTGTNNYADTTTIQNGTLRVTGTNTFIAGAFGLYNVGSVGNQNGVLELIGATVNANKNSNPSIQVGAAANARGFVKLNSSTLATVSELHVGQGSGAAATTPYASLTMDAGSVLSSGSYLVVGLNNDRAVLNQSGGSVNVVANVMTVGAGGTGCIGVANLSGGSFTATNAANGGTFVGENGLGILNVSGTAAVTNVFNGLILGRTGAGSAGIVNLLGGKINVNRISKGAGTAAFNFNGGTLQANVANPAFMTGLTSAYVYGGGARIDDGGFDVTIGQQLLAPSGSGVASIPVTAGGSGYIDTPLVLITNIDGSGATAIAQIDYSTGGATSGQVTNILVTNPGNDYSTPPTVALFGGGGTGATLGVPTLAANVSGGLTKIGAGSLTLSGGSTYTGNTVVNGGTLSLNSSTVTPATAGSLTVNNAALAVDVSSGTSLLASSLTLQNNATNTFSYGALSANPSFPAINVAGGITTAGATINLNISALGLKIGQFVLIKYTGTPLASIANFSVTLPPGVVATLVNNTGNDSIDLNVTTSPKFLTWYGAGNNNWDINATVNWKDGGVDSIYQQYTNGATIVGDAVLFDDTLTNDFVNPQPTNVNLTVGLSSFPVIFDSTLPYSFVGAGSLVGGGYLVKSNTGSLTIGTSNNFTGGTLIYGGSVIITNDSALGGSAGKLTLGGGTLQVNANSTNATRAVGVTAASSIAVATNVTLQYGGIVNGAGGLSKTDNGTLVLTGSNGITGNLSVNQGTLRNTGTEVLPAVVRVGNTAGLNGVLAIPAGTFQAANNAGQFTSSLIAGSAATSAGDILLNGGTLNVMQQLGLGAGTGGYGAMTMTSGTLNCGSYIVVGFNNDRAVFNMSSGTTTISSNLMTIAAGGPLSIGVANISGGTFTAGFATSSGIMVGERGAGTLNVSGTAVINVPTNTGLTIGPVGSQTGWDGTANLNGGTVTAIKVARGTGTGAAKIGFNGGTLKASTGNNTFMQSLDSATIYANGATFDDGGFSITVPQPLLGAAGYGVSSITLASGGAGYIDTPILTLSGGSGSNATATATVSGGVVTAVTVTSPGSGYSSGDVLSVTFDAASGGATVTTATANTPVLAQNISGGLTKKGAGTLNLTGANTYTNTTAVTAGSLLVGPAHQVTGPVTVSSNAAFGALFTGPGAATVGKLTLGSVAADKTTLTFALSTGSNPTAPILQTGALTVNGTNTVRLSGSVTAGTFPLLQYVGAISFVGAATFNTNVIVPQGQTATLSNYVAGSTLYVTVVGSPGIVWTGTNSVVALTNVWNLNSGTNWLAAGVPTSYLESAPPGDPVLFNDIGSGLVLLSNTVSPASIQISNNTVTYAFRGTGRLSGTTGVTKQGSGTANIAVAGNDYTGNTTVSNGTLQLGSTTTIPDGIGTGAVILGGAGTLDINSFSETINGLSGSGTINNSGGTTATLTVGNGNSSANWNGTTTNTGAGGVTFVKVGTGSMTVGGTNFFQGTCMVNGGSNTLNSTASVNVIGTGEFWIGGSSTAPLPTMAAC